jgi:hypothetical protein
VRAATKISITIIPKYYRNSESKKQKNDKNNKNSKKVCFLCPLTLFGVFNQNLFFFSLFLPPLPNFSSLLVLFVVKKINWSPAGPFPAWTLKQKNKQVVRDSLRAGRGGTLSVVTESAVAAHPFLTLSFVVVFVWQRGLEALPKKTLDERQCRTNTGERVIRKCVGAA